MGSLIDFIESEAKANAAFHIANGEAMAKEGNTLLGLLLAGAGGMAAYFVGLAGKGAPNWQLAGVGGAATYLFIVAGLTLWSCLWVRPIWPPANEPANFPLDGFDVDAVRIGDLPNRQACITANRERNDSVGMWLNRCRALAAATPIIAIACAAVALAV
jgi:hypothetical protein